MKKKIVVSVLLILLLCMLCCKTYASNKGIMELAKEWMSLGKQNATSITHNNNNNDEFLEIAGILTGLGIWVIVISGAVLGIRFMMATPDQKAEMKKGLTIYLIGTVIILGAVTIWKAAVALLDIS